MEECVPTKPSIWSEQRFKSGEAVEAEKAGHRTVFEQDYDRILFSSAVRRLSDKTQVFPLDANDSVRTRLTHSHEVANLARSIGLRAKKQDAKAFGDVDFHLIVAPLLRSSGLAHDLGNPPFGHQGEAAICSWFGRHHKWIFGREKEGGEDLKKPIDQEYRSEFLKFDGNPQSFRLLTRLQTSYGNKGLDLSAATLACCMKYVASNANVDKKSAALRKTGYFHSESDIVDWVRSETGLKADQRHPLAWITEAADDSAYSVLDVEDSMKKGILSPDDLLNILRTTKHVKDMEIVSKLHEKFELTDGLARAPSIRRDIKIGYLRSFLIEALVIHATNEFLANRDAIWKGDHKVPLMEGSALCKTLKDTAFQYAFGNPEVLFVEGKGRLALEGLLDFLWEAIRTRDGEEIDSKRKAAFSRYVYSLISANYIEAAQAEFCSGEHASRLRYRELRLLTDMISGMTDRFAMDLHEKIKHLKNANT
jgi:dGTPase